MAKQEALMLDKEEFTALARNPSFRAVKKSTSWHVQSTKYIHDEAMQIMKVSQQAIDNTKSAQIDSLSLDSIIPEPAFDIYQNIFTYPVFSLSHHQLNRPIEIMVETDAAGNVIVWNEDFGLTGIGNTKEEALEEFEELIISDYNSLKKFSVRDLSDGAKRLLSIYKDYLD